MSLVINYKQPELPLPATSTGYDLPDGATFDDWISDGEKLKYIDKWKNFAIGDWLLAGQNKFGEVCYDAVDESWGSYSKLTKLVWVAKSVPHKNRNMALTWTHHHHVASIEDKQEQAKWLHRAHQEAMTSDDLRDAIRASQQPSQTAYHPLPADLHEMQHRSANGHTLPDDEGDDVPFSFGRNGSSYEGERDGDANRFLDTSVLVHNGMGNYYELSHGTKQCAKCKRLWAADINYCPYCHISPEARADYVQREQERNRPHVANNSGNNEWYTPEHYTTAARAVMGEITLDPASSELANTKVKAAQIYTADDDGLSMPWFGKVWLNPPYAAGLVDKFASKLVNEYESGEVDEAIVLVNNATETAWFASLVSVASAICFPSQRVRFWSPSGEPGAPLQGQAVVYVGENAGSFVDHFSQIGWCAWVA